MIVVSYSKKQGGSRLKKNHQVYIYNDRDK